MLAQTTRDVDYRIIYTREAEFKQKITEIYIAKLTHLRPPFFHEILSDLMEYDMWVYLFEDKQHNMSKEERESFIHELNYGDMERLYQFRDEKFIELFTRDLYLFLLANRFAFMDRDFYDRHLEDFKNSPIKDFW